MSWSLFQNPLWKIAWSALITGDVSLRCPSLGFSWSFVVCNVGYISESPTSSQLITCTSPSTPATRSFTSLCVLYRHLATLKIAIISHCVSNISCWFLENGMLLNPNKTKTVLFGTHLQRELIGRDVCWVEYILRPANSWNCLALYSTKIFRLIVTSYMSSLDAVITREMRIRPLTDLTTARLIAQGVVTSLLGLIYGTFGRNIERRQVTLEP